MNDPCTTPGRDPDHRRDLIQLLTNEGWETAYSNDNPRAHTARLVSPNRLLHATVHQNPVPGGVRARIGTLPGGAGEPARWYASGTVPSTALWIAAARAALNSHDRMRRPNQPCAVLELLGWTHGETRRDDTRLVEAYTCPDGARRVTYTPSARAAPALWKITWPEAEIGIAVTAAEPYALPAFVLGLLNIPEQLRALT